jgi:HPt (histidine-containing phosphotransfer) domain-containing protein
MSSPDLSDVIAQLWNGFRGVARSRVDLLETYEAALRAGSPDEELSQSAVAAAHKLAGSLGSYGRPGSDAAAALERLLRTQPPPDVEQVAELVRRLRTAVDG